MHLLIDTDPGMGTINSDPEDCFAIAFALDSPEAAVVAITTVHGNVPLAHGFANAQFLLSMLGAGDGVELAAGVSAPMLGPSLRSEQVRWLKEKGLSQRLFPAAAPPYPGRHAIEVIKDAAELYQDLVIAAIGPLTNIATALTVYPHIAGLLKRIVLMGGAFGASGNITPTAEFNFFMDPEAAAIVLNSGVPITIVGLEMCVRTSLTSAEIDENSTGSEFGQFVKSACGEWLQTMQHNGLAGLHLFDSLAVAAALKPELFTTEPAYVAVDVSAGITAGTSSAWLEGHPSSWTKNGNGNNVEIVNDFDLTEFKNLFRDRVLKRL